MMVMHDFRFGGATSVEEWAEGVTFADESEDGQDNNGDGDQDQVDENEGNQDLDPQTPPSQFLRFLCVQVDEISPTETNFSSDQVFDSPFTPLNLTRSPKPYAETDASSIEDASAAEDEEDTPKLGHETALPAPNSAPPFDPTAKRLIWITSCLQCVLAGLPCSRTLPACTRCVRKGEADMCLLHRERLHVEMYNAEGLMDRTPILLKVFGADPGIARKKADLVKELLAHWTVAEDRRNWVLPLNDGKRGDFRSADAKIAKMHPGAGIGRTGYYELLVDYSE